MRMTTPSAPFGGPPTPGLLVSIEGISGVGKTYLTRQLTDQLSQNQRDLPPILIEEFSQRTNAGDDLGRDLLRSLIDAAQGDPFLRAGHPGSETLLLLAIKTHDYEIAQSYLQQGRVVIEGRSLHSTAVYQSLIVHPGDSQAHARAHRILGVATLWRPRPDLTILIRDDLDAAVRRAERRDAASYRGELWRLHARADALFSALAEEDPLHVRTLDRRSFDATEAASQMTDWIRAAHRARGDMLGERGTAPPAAPCLKR
jgi:dTMP kinase